MSDLTKRIQNHRADEYLNELGLGNTESVGGLPLRRSRMNYTVPARFESIMVQMIDGRCIYKQFHEQLSCCPKHVATNQFNKRLLGGIRECDYIRKRQI